MTLQLQLHCWDTSHSGSSPKSVTAPEALWMLKFVSQRSFGEFAWHRVSADHDLGRPTVLSYLVLWEGTPDCAERSEPPLGDPVHPRFFEVRSNQARQGRHRLTLGAFPPSRRNRCVARHPQLIDGKTLTLNYTVGTRAQQCLRAMTDVFVGPGARSLRAEW